MVTVAEEILKRYYTLQQTVKEKVGSFPLPELGSYDATDIATLVVTYFNSNSNYKPALRRIIDYQGLNITDAQLDECYPDVKAFIDWLIATVRDFDSK